MFGQLLNFCSNLIFTNNSRRKSYLHEIWTSTNIENLFNQKCSCNVGTAKYTGIYNFPIFAVFWASQKTDPIKIYTVHFFGFYVLENQTVLKNHNFNFYTVTQNDAFFFQKEKLESWQRKIQALALMWICENKWSYTFSIISGTMCFNENWIFRIKMKYNVIMVSGPLVALE